MTQITFSWPWQWDINLNQIQDGGKHARGVTRAAVTEWKAIFTYIDSENSPGLHNPATVSTNTSTVLHFFWPHSHRHCTSVLLDILLVGCWCFTSLQHLRTLVLTWDSVHSWWLYCAAPLGNQAANTMTWYPTKSHYPNIELTSHCIIVLLPNAMLGSDKYQFDKSLVWLDQQPNSPYTSHQVHALPIQPYHFRECVRQNNMQHNYISSSSHLPKL